MKSKVNFPFIVPVIAIVVVSAVLCGAADAVLSHNVPERIISLGPANTENLYLLGAGDRLVGDTVYCVRPPEAQEKEKVGTMMELSVEKILNLQPDLVLATGLTPAPLLQKLEEVGVAVAYFPQPASFEQSCSQFIELGQLLGLEKKARQIIDQVRARAKRIEQAVHGLKVQKVALQIGSKPLYLAIPGMFTHDFIVLSGGSNIAEGQASGRIDYEKVIIDNPDVIIIAMMGSETGIAGQEKLKWQQYPTISAVRTGRIHIVDPNVSCSPSPATFVETLELIAGFIHPDASFQKELP